jgi:hypothetical protein
MKLTTLVPILLLVSLALLALAVRWQSRRRRERRANFIKAYAFSAALRGRVSMAYPQLDSEQIDQVFRALRQYFLLCLQANAVNRGKVLGMPSKVVDEAWHAFILHSREYTQFCDRAFGRYLHHAPDSAMKTSMDHAIGNTFAALKAPAPSSMGWATLAGVPLLFALDKAYGIPDGHYYDQTSMASLERKRQSGGGGCGGGDFSFADAGAAGGGHAACGDSGSGCGDAGGSSGCGGGGCGGGGCGSE